MRGLANLDYGKKILITNSVKEEFKNIEIQERAQAKTSCERGIPSSQQNPLSWVGRVIFVDFWFQRIRS